MKIIDWQKKGNLVRLYLGKDDLEDWSGDDWDDTPYEHNAEEVSSKFVKSTADLVIPFDLTVLEPCEEWSYNSNSPYSKDDLKAGKAPCIVVVKTAWRFDNSFLTAVADKDSIKIYLGQRYDQKELDEKIEKLLIRSTEEGQR